MLDVVDAGVRERGLKGGREVPPDEDHHVRGPGHRHSRGRREYAPERSTSRERRARNLAWPAGQAPQRHRHRVPQEEERRRDHGEELVLEHVDREQPSSEGVDGRKEREGDRGEPAQVGRELPAAGGTRPPPQAAPPGDVDRRERRQHHDDCGAAAPGQEEDRQGGFRGSHRIHRRERRQPVTIQMSSASPTATPGARAHRIDGVGSTVRSNPTCPLPAGPSTETTSSHAPEVGTSSKTWYRIGFPPPPRSRSRAIAAAEPERGVAVSRAAVSSRACSVRGSMTARLTSTDPTRGGSGRVQTDTR